MAITNTADLNLQQLDADFYTLKKRADILQILIAIVMEKPVSPSRRDRLSSLGSILESMEVLCYLTGDRKFPKSHYDLHHVKINYNYVDKSGKALYKGMVALAEKLKKFDDLAQDNQRLLDELDIDRSWNDWLETFFALIRGIDLLEDV